MEGVGDRLKRMNLCEAERKGVKIGWRRAVEKNGSVAKAMGKLFSDKPGYAEGMAVEGGKKKALENVPWTFGKDLLVMEDFDPRKTLHEYTFATVLIWVRIYNIPLGMMCKELGEDLAEEIGELMEVEGEEDGTALENA
ncbi:hypothetical protein D1007_19743 [Hordeum vulgare]|nr:hypothetical protein D1007_19743 [Hordeum vulgare]